MKFKYVIIYKILLLFTISILFNANRPTPGLRGFTRNYKDIRKEILMNTVQLECFLAVAEYLNFSRAADFLKITQPAVSHQITSLEEELGIRLFVRTSKNVSLTEAGLMFMEDASSILKIASGAKKRLGMGIGDFLSLTVGCHNQSELDLLPPVIHRLAGQFPTLHPSVKLIPFKSMANLLEEERIHVMFGFGQDDQKKSIGIFHELARTPMACVCSTAHPYAGRASLNVKELKGPMVLGEPHRLPQSVLQSQIRVSSSSCHPSELFFVDTYESILAMVRAGLGYTLLPFYPGSDKKGLCYIPVTDIPPLVFGLYHKGIHGNVILKEFIRLLDEAFV